jgi:hypothetical protein
MPVEFEIVGEHLENPAHLLVLGADGAFYDYDPSHERLAPTEPDARWLLLPTLDEVSE